MLSKARRQTATVQESVMTHLLPHRQAAKRFGLQSTCSEKYRPNGPEINDTLIINTDDRVEHSKGHTS
jgi:hypothetical protein